MHRNPYIMRSPHTLSLPGARAKLHRALTSSGRGVTVMRHGVGASPTQPVTDQQYNASADAPGASAYMRVDTLQCALNAWAGPSNPQLTVDGKWGPHTAAGLSDFIHAMNASPPQAPRSASDYHYVSPVAGATMVQITNALGDALVSGRDVTACVVANATGRGNAPATNYSTPGATPAPAPIITAPPSSFDWTTWGIAGAGALALGAVGYAVLRGRRARKKGRR